MDDKCVTLDEAAGIAAAMDGVIVLKWMFSERVMGPGLGLREVFAYAIVDQFCRANGIAEIPVGFFSEHGIGSRRTVERVLATLESAGLIESYYAWRGPRRAKVYTVGRKSPSYQAIRPLFEKNIGQLYVAIGANMTPLTTYMGSSQNTSSEPITESPFDTLMKEVFTPSNMRQNDTGVHLFDEPTSDESPQVDACSGGSGTERQYVAVGCKFDAPYINNNNDNDSDAEHGPKRRVEAAPPSAAACPAKRGHDHNGHSAAPPRLSGNQAGGRPRRRPSESALERDFKSLGLLAKNRSFFSKAEGRYRSFRRSHPDLTAGDVEDLFVRAQRDYLLANPDLPAEAFPHAEYFFVEKSLNSVWAYADDPAVHGGQARAARPAPHMRTPADALGDLMSVDGYARDAFRLNDELIRCDRGGGDPSGPLAELADLCRRAGIRGADA